MSKFANFFFGLVTGALVGSAIALLMTPASGRQLRADLQGYTDQVRKEVELAAQTRRAEMQEQLARLRGEIVSE
jgi:gas vesicle protein